MTIEPKKGIASVALALAIAGAWVACISSNLLAQTKTTPTPTPAATRITPQECPPPNTGGITIIGAEPREEYCSQSGKVAQPPIGGLTFTDVIRLSQAGLSDDVIIAQIKKSKQVFDLSTHQLIQLKAAHVSDRVIEAMTGTTPATPQMGSNVAGRGPEQHSLDLPASTPIKDDISRVPQWASSKESDSLTGKSYISYVLTGRYLTAPSEGTSTAPHISLRCDPSLHHKLSGHLLAGFIDVGTVIDLEDGQVSTVKYRLNDGKVQTATYVEVGNSTNYQAISIKDIFLNNLLWGHMLKHKPHSGGQVHKVVVSVREHLDGDVVMQFDMPDAREVGEACGTEYRQ